MTPTNQQDAHLEKYLTEQGYSDLKPMDDGTYAGLLEYLFTTALLTGLNEQGYHTRYCYAEHGQALEALAQYTDKNVDPTGPWIKAKGVTGDRINPEWSNSPEPSAFREDNVEVVSAVDTIDSPMATVDVKPRRPGLKK